MRPQLYSSRLQVKIDPTMLTNFKKVAQNEGITVSELVRYLLMKYLGDKKIT